MTGAVWDVWVQEQADAKVKVCPVLAKAAAAADNSGDDGVDDDGADEEGAQSNPNEATSLGDSRSIFHSLLGQ